MIEYSRSAVLRRNVGDALCPARRKTAPPPIASVSHNEGECSLLTLFTSSTVFGWQQSPLGTAEAFRCNPRPLRRSALDKTSRRRFLANVQAGAATQEIAAILSCPLFW